MRYFASLLFVVISILLPTTSNAAINNIPKEPAILAEAMLPAFYHELKAEQRFTAAWQSQTQQDIRLWRQNVRTIVRNGLLWPEHAIGFAPELIASEPRNGYRAERWLITLTPGNRVPVLLLRPAGEGPFGAVLLLHDHGAHFSIGKEKVIRPFADDSKLPDALAWVERHYGGSFIGDELAMQGYLVLAAIGFSMGAFRAWQLSALTDDIQAAAAISWMTTTDTTMTPGNNQLRGQTAFWMVHPGLAAQLDYPHIAAIAAPKPALFITGAKDKLMPATGTLQAYQLMQQVWQAHDAEQHLVTELWPEMGHEFAEAQQQRVWQWLSTVFSQP